MNSLKGTQKVRVVNFPLKDKWQKVVLILSLIVSIISLSFAGLSTYLYIKEISKTPDIMLGFDSPTPILGKTVFKFDNEKLSNPLKLHVYLYNKGRKKSESLTKLMLMFDKQIKVFLESNRLWQENVSGSFQRFNYVKDETVINKETSRNLGVFDIAIPKQLKRLLIAVFIIEGDFNKKSGLVYYDFSKENYTIEYYGSTETANLWNERYTR